MPNYTTIGGGRACNLPPPQKTENFTQFVNINVPQWRIPCAFFTIFSVLVAFYGRLTIKIWGEGFWSYAGLISGAHFPKFLAAPGGETTSDVNRLTF